MSRRLLSLSLGLFLLSAALAVPPAYDRWLAVWRLGLMALGTGGLLVQRRLGQRRPGALLGVTSLAAATLGGLALTLPQGLSPTFPADVFGGLLAALTPALLASVVLAGRRWRAGALAALALAVAGLARTMEMPALAALGLVLAGSWLLFVPWPSKALGLPLFTLPAVAVVWLSAGWGGLESRLDVARQAFLLAEDFPLTGGGLGAFPGLYAWYIRGVPFLYLDQAHNLYANVAVEQGALGLAALLGVLLAALWQGWQAARRGGREARWLGWAGLAGVATLAAHGLMEDAAYAPLAGLPLFWVVGLSAAAAPQARGTEGRGGRVVALAGALLLLALLAVNIRAVAAAAYANLGAVRMARVDLANWPEGGWVEGRGAALRPAEQAFTEALNWDPAQRTAHHRLGLIALDRRDFSAAAAHLELAMRASPEHRGVRKVLAYAYLWSGRPESARELLQDLPEARGELANYAGWWRARGRQDLAAAAAEMARALVSPADPGEP